MGRLAVSRGQRGVDVPGQGEAGVPGAGLWPDRDAPVVRRRAAGGQGRARVPEDAALRSRAARRRVDVAVVAMADRGRCGIGWRNAAAARMAAVPDSGTGDCTPRRHAAANGVRPPDPRRMAISKNDNK